MAAHVGRHADRHADRHVDRPREGAPCWADVMLADLEAGKRFYGGLFGWSFGEPVSGRDAYTLAYLDDGVVAGLFVKPDGRMPTVWNLYLATDDAKLTASRIREAGGRMLMDPMPVNGVGVNAVGADPEGAVFGLWQTRTQSGFEVRERPGAYIWAEVYARDKMTADAFYTEVFGYGMRDIDAGGGADFALWALEGDPVDDAHAVGGRCLIESTFAPQMPAQFLTYFAAADCDETARTAVRLGGRVLRGPEDSPYGRFAVLTDDQGASFAVLEPPSGEAAG
ncbi:VOC family protein [Streptomyces sp. NPDC054796]